MAEFESAMRELEASVSRGICVHYVGHLYLNLKMAQAAVVYAMMTTSLSHALALRSVEWAMMRLMTLTQTPTLH